MPVSVDELSRGERRCPFCHAGVAERDAVWTCPACATLHHAECADESGACCVHGCGAVHARAPRSSRRLVFVALVLALAASGVASAILIAPRFGAKASALSLDELDAKALETLELQRRVGAQWWQEAAARSREAQRLYDDLRDRSDDGDAFDRELRARLLRPSKPGGFQATADEVDILIARLKAPR
jgi:hypothetical protein